MKRIVFYVDNDEAAQEFFFDTAKTDGLIAYVNDNGDDVEMLTTGMSIEDGQ